ncbi:MAG: response regulator [Planctomycetota bacterium]|jgi:PAS domain S-box-containing protein|nr:response regulator [Planctomycetota bacterium]
MSLRWRLTLAFLVTCSLVLGGVGTLLHFRLANTLRAEQTHSIQASLARLGHTLRQPLWDLNLALVDDLVVAEMMANRHLAAVSVQVIGKEDEPITFERDDGWTPLRGLPLTGSDASHPVYHGTRLIATITTRSTDRFVSDALHERALEQIIEILLLDAVLVALVAVLLNRVLLRQLGGISKAIEDAPDMDLPSSAERDPVAVISAGAEALLARLHTILNAIGDAIVVTDAQLRIQRVNPGACELLGLPADHLIGAPLAGLLPRKVDGKALGRQLEKHVLLGGREFRPAKGLQFTVNGQARHIALAASPIKQAERVEGLVLVLHDLTAVHAMEQELQQTRKLESIGQLAGGIAHDFNNMLAAISGSAELIASHPDDVERRTRYLDTIVSTSSQAADLNRKLLAFARKGPIQRRPTALREVIDQACDMLSHSIDRRISVTIDHCERALIVEADLAALVNALLNLGINARDAMTNGGEFHIASLHCELDSQQCHDIHPELKAGAFARIEVSDTGTGIASEALSKIFDPFFTTKPVGAGTGLGLAATYGTIRAHGGTIAVESQPNVGTTFTIYLPLCEGLDPTPSANPAAQWRGSGHILVVDDDDAVRSSTDGLVTSLGFTVTSAPGGGEAIARIEAGESYDLIMLDLIMPSPNGEETFHRLRELSPDTPVILMSGYADGQDVNRLIKAGAQGPLAKPFTRVDLATALYQVLGPTTTQR